MNDETIYMGNTQNEDMNESERKSVSANVWKPITIGGFTGILLGAGALMTSNASAANQDSEQGAQDESATPNDTPVEDLLAGMTAEEELGIADIEGGLSFEDAFATAREQVGPGGIFYWHGAVFSTYTADEWEAMSDDDHERYASQVRPEVGADQIDTDQIAALDIPESEEADEVENVEAAPVEDTPVAEMSTVDEVASDMPVQDFSEDVAMADVEVAPQEFVDDVILDEDVQIADFQPQKVIEDLALADVSAKSIESMDVEAQPVNIAHEFDADNDVRIVGYGEYDGHIVTGLDLDGDNMTDIAVIDVDDSGNYSRADIVIDSEGNMSTYGELEDFAHEQMPGEDNDQLNEAQAQNPDVAQDMPDYMDDALAQV